MEFKLAFSWLNNGVAKLQGEIDKINGAFNKVNETFDRVNTKMNLAVAPAVNGLNRAAASANGSLKTLERGLTNIAYAAAPAFGAKILVAKDALNSVKDV